MNRNSWLIIGATFLICLAYGFFFIRPVVTNSFQTYRQIAQAKKELNDINKKKEILTKISQNDQLKNLYQTAIQYLPQEADSSNLVLELSALASQNNLKVEQISSSTTKAATQENQDTSTNNSNQNNQQNTTNSQSEPGGSQTADFELKVSGTFSDYLNFLNNLETSGRLISIPKMNLTQGTGTFSAQLSIKAYWKKGLSLEKNLANINVSTDTIQKFQNIKSNSTPINITTEQGFGRPNPFDATQ